MGRTLVGAMAVGTLALALWSILRQPGSESLAWNPRLAHELEALRRKALCRLVG